MYGHETWCLILGECHKLQVEKQRSETTYEDSVNEQCNQITKGRNLSFIEVSIVRLLNSEINEAMTGWTCG